MSETYIVAVSGGVDSVALLHMLTKNPTYQLVVAHFDHGIRPDSASDAQFVKNLAKTYGHKFETKREELGVGASEELARDRRYNFLRNLADKHSARIMTAHHADDAIETVAINTKRGTGWRGLAVLDSDIVRPLIDMTKQEILDYAKQNKLEWREDPTNQDTKHLRNLLRSKLRNKTSVKSAENREKVLGMRKNQINLKRQIDSEVRQLVGEGPQYSRHFFINASDSTAMECLRFVTEARLTRPQLTRFLVAIKTAKPNSTYNAGGGFKASFTTRNFSLKLIK